MKLSQLLEKSPSPPDSLPKNFGDGYLMQNNHVFAKIRRAAIQAGFEYSLERNDAYLALPLTQLESVLKSKKIPYIDNVSVLKEVEVRLRQGAYWDDVTDNLKKNHVFHESCHAVARSITLKNLDFKKESTEEKVLRILLEESFANACELLAVTDANDATHRIFFEWNSYVCMFEDKTNLKKAQAEMGWDFIFHWMWLSYLQANFLDENLTEKKIQRILALLPKTKNIDPQKIKILRSFSKIAFQLNSRFREVTTRLHLQLQGLKTPHKDLINFDFLSTLEKSEKLKQTIKDLVEIVRP